MSGGRLLRILTVTSLGGLLLPLVVVRNLDAPVALAATTTPSRPSQTFQAVMPQLSSELAAHRDSVHDAEVATVLDSIDALTTEESLPAIRTADGTLPIIGSISPEQDVYAYPAGNFDGDGLPDVLIVKDAFTEGNVPVPIAVEGRDGATGARLWSHTEYADFGLTIPFDVGTPGHGGALMMLYTYPTVASPASSVSQVTLELLALAPNGTVVWRGAFPTGIEGEAGDTAGATGVPAASEVTVPLIGGWGRILPGPAETFIVDLESSLASSVPGASPSSTITMAINGATGQITWVSSRTGLTGSPYALDVGDLNGDGLDDLLYAGSTAPDGSTLEAISGATGSPLWTSSSWSPSESFLQFTNVGDTTGSGWNDLAIGYLDQYYGANPGLVTLLGGQTGNVLWQKRGAFPRELRDIEGLGRSDVGLQIPTSTSDSVGVDYVAYRGDGTTAYSVDHTYTGPFCPLNAYSPPASGASLLGDLGDLTGSGSEDSGDQIFYFDDCNTNYFGQEAVSGATGQTLWTGTVGFPFFSSLTGTGDDLYILPSQWATFEAQSGPSGQILWSSPIPSATQWIMAIAGPVGSGTAAVINYGSSATNSPNGDTTIEVRDGAAGSLTWTVTES